MSELKRSLTNHLLLYVSIYIQMLVRMGVELDDNAVNGAVVVLVTIKY